MVKKSIFFVMLFFVFINGCVSINNFYDKKHDFDYFLIKKLVNRIDERILINKKIYINYFSIFLNIQEIFHYRFFAS